MISETALTILKRSVVSLIAIAIFLGAGAWGGFYFGLRHAKAEAVKQGHARFIVQDEYGKTVFQWLDKGDTAPVK